MTPDEKRAIAAKLRTLNFGNKDNSKAWAWRLRDIELNHGGLMPFDPRHPMPVEKRLMTPAQRESWRSALEHELKALARQEAAA
jgi:hypothetical protein